MRKLLFVILFVFVPLFIIAQNEIVSKINSIKIDSTYLYGEMTLKTQEEASIQAKDILKIRIKEWIETITKVSCTTSLEPLVEMADSIVTPRANMIRFFSYVSKYDILPLLNSAGELTIKDNQSSEIVPVQNQITDSNQEILNQILGVKSFYQLKGIMEPLHKEGHITEYGKYATMEDASNSYLIIYDPDGDIRAVLGKGTSIRKNLSTGNDDSEHNYSGCGAIWFKLND